MNLPYPSDPASMSQSNPLFNDNAFVRGDQFRLNNSRIWDNFTTIATQIFGSKGTLSGKLKLNTTSLPPKISKGEYGVKNVMLYATSDIPLALTDALQQSKQSFDDFCHYVVLVDDEGNAKYALYGEGAVSGATGNVSSITSVGTTYTLTVGTGTVGSHTDKILVINGNNNVNGVFLITGGNGSSTYTFETQAGYTNGNASGTWAVYERIKTRHGTGTSVAVTSDAEVIKYTPSFGLNGWDASFYAYDGDYNGFYCNLTGLTGYRVLGFFQFNGTVVTNVYTFGSGMVKPDNNCIVRVSNSRIGVILRYTTVERLHGCNYVFTDDGTNGSIITVSDTLFMNSTCQFSISGDRQAAITINDTMYTPSSGRSMSREHTIAASNTFDPVVVANTDILHENDIIRTVQSSDPETDNYAVWKTTFFQM